MSSEFYFNKWKKTLARLEGIVKLDIQYQTSKAHDKSLCDATLRLSEVLGQYLTIYNHIMECLHQNLQVQKTWYIQEAVKVVVGRILELRHDLTKLTATEHQYLNNGLILHKLTYYDSELSEIPNKVERPEEIQHIIEKVIQRVNERKRHIEQQKIIEERGIEEEHVDNWWDEDRKVDVSVDSNVEKKSELNEEEIAIKTNLEIIQAHERTRQVVAWRTQHTQKRQKWQREIEGKAAPIAPYEIRERSAAIIQKVCRAFFKCKRERYLDCKRDELLGIRQCSNPTKNAQEKLEQIKAKTPELKKQYEKDWISDLEIIKENYRRCKGDEICESYRDHIRDWFHIWFEDIKLFYDIPGDKEGGSKLILKEELPTPHEYLEEYEAFMVEKKSKKNESALQKKYEKMAANKQKDMDKKIEIQKKRLEKELRRKIMKNPSQHPGFNYHQSKKAANILKVIEDYHTDWDEFDKANLLEVKERHCNEVDRNKATLEVILEVIPQVDEIMRVELKQLKVALKKDYTANEKEMPEPIKKKTKKQKKKKLAVKTTASENLVERLEELVFQGIIKVYPRTKLKEFIGDPNFAGDEVRCNYGSTLPFNGETRSMWWEKCREMTYGFHRILLVGSRGSGKNMLLNALASLNDAVLFELDPNQIRSELASDVYLQQVVQHVVSCAKVAQPSVIHIKHVHRFYYKKVPREEAEMNIELFKRHLTKNLLKKIHKTDKITVIGSCIDPWMTNSKQMLKHFPNVVLMPNTNYTTVVQMLNEWTLSNHAIPTNFSVSCLAHALQGYSFGYLKEFLDRFMSPERIARISINGLTPEEVFNSILDEGVEKVEYEKYVKWLSNMTPWGKREKQHFEEQREFKEALEKWALRKEMEKRKAEASTASRLDTNSDE